MMGFIFGIDKFTIKVYNMANCNNKKCLDCNLCMDLIYLHPTLKQYWRCWLCGRWYVQDAEGKLIEVADPTDSTSIFVEGKIP